RIRPRSVPRASGGSTSPTSSAAAASGPCSSAEMPARQPRPSPSAARSSIRPGSETGWSMQTATSSRRGTVLRVLRYARPDLHHVLGATFFGILKFTLPATTAIALRFMTDRLVTGSEAAPEDVTFRLTARTLAWLAGVLPASWGLAGSWGQFQLHMVT